MVVRIRLHYGLHRRTASSAPGGRPAIVAALLMTPLALLAWGLGGLRLAAELQWMRDFALRTGLFSRWQVWAALGIVIQFASFLLHGYARRRFDRRRQRRQVGP